MKMYQLKLCVVLPFISRNKKVKWLHELETLPIDKLNETNKRFIENSIILNNRLDKFFYSIFFSKKYHTIKRKIHLLHDAPEIFYCDGEYTPSRIEKKIIKLLSIDVEYEVLDDRDDYPKANHPSIEDMIS